MRSLVLLLIVAFAGPAWAGDFVPRQPPPAASPATKPVPRRAKPVRKVTRTASKPKKKSKQHQAWKRPMP
jgi:hypothetical protein